jgi:hypothetical protein
MQIYSFYDTIIQTFFRFCPKYLVAAGFVKTSGFLYVMCNMIFWVIYKSVQVCKVKCQPVSGEG